MTRADADAPNMGLTSWKGAVVRKQDVIIAKNYLTHDELDSLNRLVVIFLETAEFRAKNRKDLTMNFWRENVDKILLSNDQRLLPNAGTVRKEHKDDELRPVVLEVVVDCLIIHKQYPLYVPKGFLLRCRIWTKYNMVPQKKNRFRHFFGT